MEKELTDLKQQWTSFRQENPKVRIRDAAKQLGVSEAELVATSIGEGTVLLKDDMENILKDVESLGDVMALTRNEHCVHERKGIYRKTSFRAHIGLVVTPDIDLRLFMSVWKYAFAVNENGRKSLQFFAADGLAIHKIYLTDKSNAEAFDQLTEKYKAGNQEAQIQISPDAAPVVPTPDEQVDQLAFRSEWLALKDTHDFYPLLKKYGLSRTQALRMAPDGYAKTTSFEQVKGVLKKASEQDLEIMVFTGNKGCIQIHTGTVKNLVETGPWYNVLDPLFNMHLHGDGVSEAWWVKKPTEDGDVNSLELFDRDGEIVVQFFGKRKPGIPEQQAWRDILATTV